jgi:hypothetical protein
MTALAARQCGPCTACCTELQIEDQALHKKAGVCCPYLTTAGCGIYETRPGVCREFLCGWRLFAELDDSWRPDLSGVLAMRKAPQELPPRWQAAGFGVHFAVTGGEAAITRPGFAEYVVRLMRQGVAVSMSAASPVTLVNDHMDAHDVETARTRLVEIWRLLQAARWRAKPLMLLPLYRLQLDRLRHQSAKNTSNNS